MTDELIPWLHNQIDAAEASTRKLLYWAQQTILDLKDTKLLGKHIPGWHDWPDVARMCQQRLAEIEAMRRILDEHAIVDPGEEWQHCRVCHDRVAHDAMPAPCMTVRLLALPFDQHPDYDESWKPEGVIEA